MRRVSTWMTITVVALGFGAPAAAQRGYAGGVVEARGARQALAPGAWLQEDPGDSIYRKAREALNQRRWEAAARLFREIRDRFPASGYVPDSYYYQAFALYRQGGSRALEEAAGLLERQHDRYADARTATDAEELLVRIQGRRARMGDAEAARDIARRASNPCAQDQELRLAALSALLNMNAERAVPILKEVLQSRDQCSVELRRRAVFLIAQHMSDDAVDVLLDLAQRNPDPDPEVREQAVFWLSQVQNEEAVAALEAILENSDDPELQERAVFALSQHGGNRAVTTLKDYAERSDVPRELREKAIFWLGQNADAGGSAYLRELYDRLEDPELRERAIFGIAQAGGPEAREWLLARAMDSGEPVEVRKNALFWAGQTGALDAAGLRDLYGTLTDVEMKEQVIFVASQARDDAGVDLLMDIARDEQDQELRERAIFWLGQSKDPRVAEFLLSLIRR